MDNPPSLEPIWFLYEHLVASENIHSWLIFNLSPSLCLQKAVIFSLLSLLPLYGIRAIYSLFMRHRKGLSCYSFIDMSAKSHSYFQLSLSLIFFRLSS